MKAGSPSTSDILRPLLKFRHAKSIHLAMPSDMSSNCHFVQDLKTAASGLYCQREKCNSIFTSIDIFSLCILSTEKEKGV